MTRTNDAYAWTGAANVDRSYTANGLNQYSAVAGTAFAHDANGNLTSDGTNSYLYDIENRLVSRSGGGSASLRYDPLGRLYEVSGASGTTRFLHDGDALTAEYDAAGNLLRRYVHGPAEGVDDPMVWFEGSGMAEGAQRYLFADERGSIVAVTDANGTPLAVNSYDEYGIPAAGNQGRFQYTGQAWVPELGMYYYKARIYSPTLGRFMQTDPIGYEDGMNMYAYVANDPINGVDPTGTSCQQTGGTGSRISGVSCTFDDRKSFEKAGWSKAQIKAGERAYTKAVQSLLRHPNRSVPVTIGDKSFNAKSGTIAKNLINTFVSFKDEKRSSKMADMAGGPATATIGAGALAHDWRPTNTRGLPFEMRIYPLFKTAGESRNMQTIIHEGIHTLPGERVFLPWQYSHQGAYGRAALDLLDE